MHGRLWLLSVTNQEQLVELGVRLDVQRGPLGRPSVVDVLSETVQTLSSAATTTQ